MKHPQILLLPALMFADYFLTVWGAVLRDKGYGSYFKVEHYELNPVWQESIRQKRWVNPRHIFITLFTSGVLAAVFELGDLPDAAIEGVFGCLFVFFGMVTGRHFCNILTFRRFARRPEEISGQLVMAHSLVLTLSTFQYVVVAVPVAIIAAFNPTPFALGGVAGTILMFVVHGIWILRQKKPSKPPDGANARQPSGSDAKETAAAASRRSP
jgi:hypothetical protein